MQIHNFLFDKAVDCVTNGLDISVDSLFSSRTEAATSARSLLITLLSEVGLSDNNIAQRLSLTRQAVNKLRHSLYIREMNNWSFRIQSQRIRKEYATLKQCIISETTGEDSPLS